MDLRLPLGLLFLLLGVLLAGYGAVSAPSLYRASLGINIDFWWGLAMLAFGVLMIGWAAVSRRAARGRKAAATSSG